MASTATEIVQKSLSRAQAAAVLRLSISAVDRLAQRKGVKKYTRQSDDRSGPVRSFYAQSDVIKLAREREPQITPDVLLARAEAEESRALTAPRSAANGAQQAVQETARPLADYLAKLAEHLTALTRATTDAQKGPPDFLTLEEASKLSGIPQPFLANLVRTDQIEILCGRGPVTWRIRRVSLAAYGAGSGS